MSVIELRTKFDEMFWVDILSRTGTNQSYLEHPRAPEMRSAFPRSRFCTTHRAWSSLGSITHHAVMRSFLRRGVDFPHAPGLTVLGLFRCCGGLYVLLSALRDAVHYW